MVKLPKEVIDQPKSLTITSCQKYLMWAAYVQGICQSSDICLFSAKNTLVATRKLDTIIGFLGKKVNLKYPIFVVPFHTL
jgi:hypothetical protein